MPEQTLQSERQAIEGHFDVVIIGGGLVGASLACALRSQALSIAVIEPYPVMDKQQPCYDDRTVALSYGSRRIFETLGLWQAMAAQAAQIKQIHISDRGHFGVTRLHSEEEGVEALGYVAENRALGEVLYRELEEADDITLFCPAKLVDFSMQPHTTEQHADHETEALIQLTLREGEVEKQLTTRLLVAADGQRSQVKRMLHIGDVTQPYQQTALIANVTPGKPHNNIAYERFTDAGPLAFLPMQGNRCSVVWTQSNEDAGKMLALGEQDFLQALQQAFGYRLGQFKLAGQRQIYPLMLQQASQLVQRRVVIVGNAAHTVHPVAGQGFNLALRDISLLAEMLVDAHRADEDIGALSLLNRYVEQREQDINRVYRFTDALVKIFSSSLPPLAHCRSLGLFAVDLLPDLKHELANQSMGLSGHLSRLNRGIRL